MAEPDNSRRGVHPPEVVAAVAVSCGFPSGCSNQYKKSIQTYPKKAVNYLRLTTKAESVTEVG